MTSAQLTAITPDLQDSLVLTVRSFLDLLKKQIEATNAALVALGESPKPLPDRRITEQCVFDVANHLDWHIRVYSVKQKEIDFFKIAAWLGMRLYHASTKTFDPCDLVAVMNSVLVNNGKSLPFDLCRKIACMLAYDKDRAQLKGNDGEKNMTFDDLALGMNGLYMIFRSASEADVLPVA